MTDSLTEEQINEFKEAFEIFEREEKGSINTKDLGALMRSFGQNPTSYEIAELLKECDPDNKGKIAFSVFVPLMMNIFWNGDDTEMQFIEAFKFYDRDKNKMVSVADFRHVLRNIQDPYTEEETEEIIRETDINENGKIEYEVFASIFRVRH